MILTLADRGILDDRGNLADDDEEAMLENVLGVGGRGRLGAAGTGFLSDCTGAGRQGFSPGFREKRSVPVVGLASGWTCELSPTGERGCGDPGAGGGSHKPPSPFSTQRETRDRERAYRAADKAKPLWEEDGQKRTLLDKYDEEEQEALQVRGGGGWGWQPRRAEAWACTCGAGRHAVRNDDGLVQRREGLELGPTPLPACSWTSKVASSSASASKLPWMPSSLLGSMLWRPPNQAPITTPLKRWRRWGGGGGMGLGVGRREGALGVGRWEGALGGGDQ